MSQVKRPRDSPVTQKMSQVKRPRDSTRDSPVTQPHPVTQNKDGIFTSNKMKNTAKIFNTKNSIAELPERIGRKNRDRITGGILLLWCLLPVFITVYTLIMGLFGALPKDVEPGDCMNYYCIIDAYRIMFRIVSVPTLLWGLFIALCHFPKLISGKMVKKTPWLYFFLALLFWAILSVMLCEDPIEAVKGSRIICDGLFSYFVYGAMFLLGASLSDRRLLKRLLELFCLVMGLMSVLLILQQFEISFIRYCFPALKAGVFINSNYFGYMICLSGTALAGLYLYDGGEGTTAEKPALKRPLYLFLFTLETVALFISDAFGCFLAETFSLALLYFFRLRKGEIPVKARGFFEADFRAENAGKSGKSIASRRKEISLLLLPAIIYVLLSVYHYAFKSADFSVLLSDVKEIAEDAENANGGSGRWQLWLGALERIRMRPVFGWGPEGFNENPKGTSLPLGSPHNDLLQIGGYLGIPALLFYIAGAGILMVGALLREFKGNPGKEESESPGLSRVLFAVSACFFVSSMFGHPEFCTTPYFWLFFGALSRFSSPFFLWDTEEIRSLQGENYRRKARIVGGLTGAFMLAAVITVCGSVFFVSEASNEEADLSAMRCAEVTMRLRTAGGADPGGDAFWYDNDGITLTHAKEAPPEPYGRGTEKDGGMAGSYLEEYGTDYGYDGTKDCTGKVILVKYDYETGEFTLEWVEP